MRMQPAERRITFDDSLRCFRVQAFDELFRRDVLDGGAASVAREQAAAREIGHGDVGHRVRLPISGSEFLPLTPALSPLRGERECAMTRRCGDV